jgi:hypothetical protein
MAEPNDRDRQMSDQTPSPMSPPVANIHNSIYDAINLSKRQQWAITNYVILVYVAIFGLSKYFDKQTPITPIERAGLSLLALLAGAYAVTLLILIQGDLGRYREQLSNIYNHWICDSERKKLKIEDRYPNPALRGVSFLVALIGVVIIGFGLLTYSLWRA